jgi:hypothetical protein
MRDCGWRLDDFPGMYYYTEAAFSKYLWLSVINCVNEWDERELSSMMLY